MRKTALLTFLLLVTCVASSAFVSAQNQSEQTVKLTLKEGTDVDLRFVDAISSKTAKTDDRVNFELDRDLRVGDTLVEKQGAKAVGTVVLAKKAGMLGKGGELNVHLDYIVAGDNRIRLRASKNSAGDDKVGTAVVLTVLFGPIGLIKHGKDIDIKAGAALKGYVDQDIPLPAIK
jgi:hypothetical protein